MIGSVQRLAFDRADYLPQKVNLPVFSQSH